MAQIFPDDDHDTIVRKYAELIRKNNPDEYQVETNLPGEKGIAIGEVCPDIVLLNPGDSKPRMAIEVETAVTLTESQAEERWKTIADHVPKLQIVLPKTTVNRAKRYCKKLGVKATFYEM